MSGMETKNMCTITVTFWSFSDVTGTIPVPGERYYPVWSTV